LYAVYKISTARRSLTATSNSCSRLKKWEFDWWRPDADQICKLFKVSYFKLYTIETA